MAIYTIHTQNPRKQINRSNNGNNNRSNQRTTWYNRELTILHIIVTLMLGSPLLQLVNLHCCWIADCGWTWVLSQTFDFTETIRLWLAQLWVPHLWDHGNREGWYPNIHWNKVRSVEEREFWACSSQGRNSTRVVFCCSMIWGITTVVHTFCLAVRLWVVSWPRFILILSWTQNVLQTWDVNCIPRSATMSSGRP